MKDLREHLSETHRTQDQYASSGLQKWVDETYRSMVRALYAIFSEDGVWMQADIAMPVISLNYEAQRLRFELVRRRFVLDGWVSAVIENDPRTMTNPLLHLRAPRETVLIQRLDEKVVVPEFGNMEAPDQAIARFLQTGATYYTSPWESVSIPPNQILRVIRRIPDTPVSN